MKLPKNEMYHLSKIKGKLLEKNYSHYILNAQKSKNSTGLLKALKVQKIIEVMSYPGWGGSELYRADHLRR